jgi:hypothetical protein
MEGVMGKHLNNGRSKSKINGRFIALPHSVVDSPGFQALSPMGVAVYIAALRLYSGSNNGMLALSTHSIAKPMNVSHMSVSRALRELVNCGLLRKMQPSSFSKKRLAAEYRLTHLPCHKTNQPPTHEYRTHGQVVVSKAAVGAAVSEAVTA